MELHILHDWTKWKTLNDENGTVIPVKYFQEGILIGHIIYQEKICNVCNRRVVRRQII